MEVNLRLSDHPHLTLDIGTRKVVGLLTVPGPGGLIIKAAERIEHTTRSMLDGQIHDVAAVTAVVAEIVRRLSAKVGTPLTEAAVAAAGRALRTFKGTAIRAMSGLKELGPEEVFALEMEAVQSAQEELAAALAESHSPHEYHYVGHSVMGARLDGLPITNLVGQRGTVAELDVIATFLPRSVVDSLQAVLERVGLEMTALTLEPIAALGVAVPQTMRHLNLVLIDIGAGTSDIAITQKGSVIAYDMVPIAGDEITEALSELYLLDFPTGEAVKRQIGQKERINFTDILGQKYAVTSEELIAALGPAVERLADQLAERILKLNGGPPQAVLLVGGGAMTPGLPAMLASKLGLPPNRVAVRGREAIQAAIKGAPNLLSGPDSITPIGIAVAARERSTLGFTLVWVGDQAVRLFRPSRLTVADALLAAGVSIRQLQGPIGKGLTVSVNGQLRIVRGTFGRPGEIRLNGEPADLSTPIQHRDRIALIQGAPGQDAKATVGELVGSEAVGRLWVNGVAHPLPQVMTVNGQPAQTDRLVADNDVIETRTPATLGEALALLGWQDLLAEESVPIRIGSEERILRKPRWSIRLNGLAADLSAPIRDGDQVVIEPALPPLVSEVAADLLREGGRVRVTCNGRPVDLPAGAPVLRRNGQPIGSQDRLAPHDELSLAPGADAPLFIHLLDRIGFTPSPPPGKSTLVMRINGRPADFTTVLQDGDNVDLTWE
jgi:cell division protein FtsA